MCVYINIYIYTHTHTHTHTYIYMCVCIYMYVLDYRWWLLVTQSCLTLIPWIVAHQAPLYMDSPGKNTGLGSHSLLQGIFLTQEWNPGLPHCRQILYHLSHQGSPLVSTVAMKCF